MIRLVLHANILALWDQTLQLDSRYRWGAGHRQWIHGDVFEAAGELRQSVDADAVQEREVVLQLLLADGLQLLHAHRQPFRTIRKQDHERLTFRVAVAEL